MNTRQAHELAPYFVYDAHGAPICMVYPVGDTPETGPLQGVFLPDPAATHKRAEWIADSLRKNEGAKP